MHDRLHLGLPVLAALACVVPVDGVAVDVAQADRHAGDVAILGDAPDTGARRERARGAEGDQADRLVIAARAAQHQLGLAVAVQVGRRQGHAALCERCAVPAAALSEAGHGRAAVIARLPTPGRIGGGHVLVRGKLREIFEGPRGRDA